jgi:protoporphyrinogen oxidase
MTLALRLRERGHRVTLIESSARTGGLASPAEHGGFMWDRFYHVILLSDLNLRGLLDTLELGDKLRWGQTRTGFFVDGRLLSLSTSVEFLRFPPLSLIDKARLAATIVYASRVSDWRRLEKIPVTDWLTRLSGRRVFERIWLPLLKSKLGDNYRIASASFIWAIIARMYAARRSGLKREMFGYVDGGYSVILDAFQRRLDAIGVETLTGAPVAEVREGEGGEVRLANGEVRSFDAVILTVPASRIPALCPSLQPAEKERLSGVVYQGIACASLLLRRPLADYYVTNITEPWVPFTGVIEMTALVDRRHFGGNSLVYLPRYLTQGHPAWQKTDAEFEAEFIAALERMYPGFRRDDVLSFQMARVRDVLAVTTLDYSDTLLPPVRSSLSRVFIVNSAQIANGTLNVNETIGLADAKLTELLSALEAAPAAAAAR